jgi:hypothetical protein
MFGSKEKLGFDPNIRSVHVEENGVHKIAFEYTVKNTIYRTVDDPISEEAAYRIVGRATRVWKVQEVVNDEPEGPRYVLKDAWLYEDSPLEGKIQEKIFANLSEDEQTEAKKYFLTIKAEERLAKTPVVPSFSNSEWVQETGSTVSSSQLLRPKGVNDQEKRGSRYASATPQQVTKHTPRDRTFTVFLEVCQSVYELKDFKSLFQCFIGVINGMSTALSDWV